METLGITAAVSLGVENLPSAKALNFLSTRKEAIG
jgi:hypothetical protein